MPEIHVVFPERGGTIAEPLAVVAAGREPVTWCFHSAEGNKVDSVEVEFADHAATFFAFPGNKEPWKLKRELKSGGVDFYGHVPSDAGYPGPKISKYTVRGYDAAGNKLVATELDPVIVKPKP